MNKNQKKYLLLITVIIIWGTIGFQVYKGYNPDEIETQSASPIGFTPIKTEKSVTYTITPDYRDPFLGKIYRKKAPVKKVKKTPKPRVVFPNITYNGVTKGQKKVYIISIDGNQEIFQLKQTLKGITLLKASNTEISLQYQGAVKKYQIIQ